MIIFGNFDKAIIALKKLLFVYGPGHILFKFEKTPFFGNISVSGKKFNSLSLFQIIFLYLSNGDWIILILLLKLFFILLKGDLYPFIRLFKLGGNWLS